MTTVHSSPPPIPPHPNIQAMPMPVFDARMSGSGHQATSPYHAAHTSTYPTYSPAPAPAPAPAHSYPHSPQPSHSYPNPPPHNYQAQGYASSPYPPAPPRPVLQSSPPPPPQQQQQQQQVEVPAPQMHGHTHHGVEVIDGEDTRPAHLHKLMNTDTADLNPLEMPAVLNWAKATKQIDWEVDLRKASTMTKFLVTKGPAGKSPPLYTYKKFTAHLKSADGKKDAHFKYKADYDQNIQTFAMKSDHWPKMQWTSSVIMSTVGGRTYDLPRYTLTDNEGTQLAFFSWLAPNGDLDCCLQFSPHLARSGVPEELVLTTLPIFMWYQWDTMLREFKSASFPQRLMTLERVRDTIDSVPGRGCTHDFASAEEVQQEIDKAMANYQADLAKQRRQQNINETLAGVGGIMDGVGQIMQATQ